MLNATWKKLSDTFEDILEDFGYFTKRAGVFVFGKAAVFGTPMLLFTLAGAVSGMPNLGLAAETVSLLSTAISAAMVAGVSVSLVQTDYLHNRFRLARRYEDEVGSVIGKQASKVQEQDLDIVSRGSLKDGLVPNPTIREKLKSLTLDRNIGMMLSTVAAVAAFLIIHEVGPVVQLLEGATAALAGEGASAMMAWPAKALTHGLAGVTFYNAVKTPLHLGVGAVTGLNDETVDDRITDIKRDLGHGHQVSQEQVMDVYVTAHPQIKEQIEAQYGSEYDSLGKAQKMRLLHEISQTTDIQQIAADLNAGTVPPEELAFTAYGQESGIGRAAPGTYIQENKNVFAGMWDSLRKVTGNFSQAGREPVPEDFATIPKMPGETSYRVDAPTPDQAAMHLHNQHEQDGKQKSFTAMVGRNRGANGLTHVEQLQRQMSEPNPGQALPSRA